MNFHGGDVYNYNGEIIDFSSNINPMGIPDSFRRLLCERLEDFTKYPDIEYQEVRTHVAAYLQIRSTEYIIPGNGAVELIYKLAASDRAERVVGLSPTFSEYRRAANAAGLEFNEIPAFSSDFTTINMEMLLENIRPNSLVIICNPNNPTGTLVEKAAMKELAASLRKLDCRLIIDEAFMEFTDNYPANSMVDVVEEFMNITVIRAATKFFGMPGIRLGYGITANIETAKAAKELMEPWNLNSAAVIAACSIFYDHSYIEKARAWIKSEREYLFEKLGNIKELRVYPSKANFHLVELIDRNMTATQLKAAMAEKGILIRTAEGFNGLSEFHFRLAVKDRESNDTLLKIIKEKVK